MSTARGTAYGYTTTFAGDGGTRTSGSFTTQPQVGDCIVVLVSKLYGVQVPTITDDASGGSNTYTQIDTAEGDSDLGITAFYTVVERTAADLIVSATWGSGSAIELANVSVAAFAVSSPNATPIGGSNGAAFLSSPPTTTDGITSGALGAPSGDGAVYCGLAFSNAAPDNFDPGTGFTSSGLSSGLEVARAEYYEQATASDIAVTFTQDGGGKVVMFGVLVNPAGGGGGGGVAFRPYYF
jgi:hypothetical protein